jgi:hypothetical protein
MNREKSVMIFCSSQFARHRAIYASDRADTTVYLFT